MNQHYGAFLVDYFMHIIETCSVNFRVVVSLSSLTRFLSSSSSRPFNTQVRLLERNELSMAEQEADDVNSILQILYPPESGNI
jgi:hypothetical protein